MHSSQREEWEVEVVDPRTKRISNAFGLIGSLLAALASGCAAHAPPRSVSDLEDRESGVVAVATSHDENSPSVTLCSGALVAPNLILTARHCVSKATTTMPSCDADGHTHNGPHFAEDADPSAISIYVGSKVRMDTDQPRAHAIQVLHPAGRVLCDADVAYVVLDRPLEGVRSLPVRLSSPVETGDYVLPVGFGGGLANLIGEKHSRDRSRILAVGPTSNAATGAVLGPREFEVAIATCRGDSGGPAIDVRTGEVVGVISRGGSCTASGNHVYTRVDSYKRLATVAFRTSEQVLRTQIASTEWTER